MDYLTSDKLLIVGAGGMIGSIITQMSLMMRLSPNVCMYDIYEPGLRGAAAEIHHCSSYEADVTWTTDPAVAFKDAKYIISSGGAPRKPGMTREDLLKGNCQIAVEFGENIRKYCPDVKHVVVIFNPAEMAALTTLIHSGLKPEQVTSLAALDSTRLQVALAETFGVPQKTVTGARTYGGHGESMAVFTSLARINGKPLSTFNLSAEQLAQIKHDTIQGGSIIMQLRGRSSFQSPSFHATKMIEAVMGGERYRWPAGTYVNNKHFQHIFMAMPTLIDDTGCHFKNPKGTEEEMADLYSSYEHLCQMRDEIIGLGLIPPVEEWKTMNPNL